MAKFDTQALKEQIAALIEPRKELRQKIVDELNGENYCRYFDYERTLSAYVEKGILNGQIEMAQRVIYMIEEQEAKGKTKNVRKTV